jgi:hypothetical protein
MTYRRLAVLIEQLPPASRTKTAMRDAMDPHELAALSAVPRPGWGPHSYTDDLLCRIGERLDTLVFALIKVNGGSPPQPDPWRRPGVLSSLERAEATYEEGREQYAQLEVERLERQANRRKAIAAKNPGPPISE